MKRVKVEMIFHIGDSEDEGVFADRAIAHAASFRDPERSGNARKPHYESVSVHVERRSWELVEKDEPK